MSVTVSVAVAVCVPDTVAVRVGVVVTVPLAVGVPVRVRLSEVEPVTVDAAGNLTQRWYHAQYGGWNAFALDPTTLAATAMLGRSLPYPVSLETVESTTAGMHVRWADDSGAGPDPAILYMLRWETLDSNRDMARPAPYPAPTHLRLYGFRK